MSCAVCRHKNDVLLMLTCGHDPCITCAALHFFNGAQFRKDFYLLRQANYWCQLCNQPTPIDTTSIEQLTNFYNKIKSNVKDNPNSLYGSLSRPKSQRAFTQMKYQPVDNEYNITQSKKSKPKQIKQIRSSKQFQNFVDLAKSQQMISSKVSKFAYQGQYNNQRGNSKRDARNSKSKPFPNKFICQKHLDEPLTYYCFSCHTTICVQCALHGNHIGHEVEAIKKASKKLKGIYENIIVESQKCRLQIEENIKQISLLIQNFRAWNFKHYQKIQQKFNELYQLLSQRQKQILDQIKQVQAKGIKQLQELRQKQETNLLNIKNGRRIFKKKLSQQPANWQINQLQIIKADLQRACQQQLKNKNKKNYFAKLQQLQYVQTSLICQAIDTIQELVSTFKVTYQKLEQQVTS